MDIHGDMYNQNLPAIAIGPHFAVQTLQKIVSSNNSLELFAYVKNFHYLCIVIQKEKKKLKKNTTKFGFVRKNHYICNVKQFKYKQYGKLKNQFGS